MCDFPRAVVPMPGAHLSPLLRQFFDPAGVRQFRPATPTVSVKPIRRRFVERKFPLWQPGRPFVRPARTHLGVRQTETPHVAPVGLVAERVKNFLARALEVPVDQLRPRDGWEVALDEDVPGDDVQFATGVQFALRFTCHNAS